VFYAVIPFANCSGCVFAGQFLDTLTEVASHEFAEAITDPALNAWWEDGAGDEIGDICNRQTTRLGGFLVQTEWSNAQNRVRNRSSSRTSYVTPEFVAGRSPGARTALTSSCSEPTVHCTTNGGTARPGAFGHRVRRNGWHLHKRAAVVAWGLTRSMCSSLAPIAHLCRCTHSFVPGDRRPPGRAVPPFGGTMHGWFDTKTSRRFAPQATTGDELWRDVAGAGRGAITHAFWAFDHSVWTRKPQARSLPIADIAISSPAPSSHQAFRAGSVIASANS